jgi:hypothetical protein
MTYPGIENDPAAVAVDPGRAAVEERRKARDEEYSKYVATQDIPWGTVPAYLEGERVATTTAERYGWEALGYVRRADVVPPPNDSVPAPLDADSAHTVKPVKNGGNK